MRLRLLLLLLALMWGFLPVSSLQASADDFNQDEESGGFGFGDLFQAADTDSSTHTTNETDRTSSTWNPVLDVSLSETFLNKVLKRYVSPDSLLKEMYVAYNTSKNGVSIRGKVQLPAEVMAEYGLPSEVGELCFESTIKLKITPSGYLGIIFPEDLTTVWPGTLDAPPRERKIKVPTGFLEMLIARTRVYLSVLSGDFTSYERRSAVLQNRLHSEQEKLKKLRGFDREEVELYIEELEMELKLIELKTKRAKFKVKSENRIVTFVSEAEYLSEVNLNAKNNCLLINPNLHKMFPFLSEVRPGEINFLNNKGSRYMKLTVNSLIRR